MSKKVAIVILGKYDITEAYECQQYFKLFNVECDIRILSAYITPDALTSFAKKAETNGYSIILPLLYRMSYIDSLADKVNFIGAYTELPVIPLTQPRDVFNVVRVLALLDKDIKKLYAKFRLSEELNMLRSDNNVEQLLKDAPYRDIEEISIDPVASDMIDEKYAKLNKNES